MTWHHDVWWPSEKHRTFVFSPYTDDDDAYANMRKAHRFRGLGVGHGLRLVDRIDGRVVHALFLGLGRTAGPELALRLLALQVLAADAHHERRQLLNRRPAERATPRRHAAIEDPSLMVRWMSSGPPPWIQYSSVRFGPMFP